MEEQNYEEVVEQTEYEQPEQEVIETDVEQEEQGEPVEESDAERNLANIRRIRKEEKARHEREMKDLQQRLKRYEEAKQEAPLTDQQKLQKTVEDLERKLIEQEIKAKYPDVDEVVSDENIQILIDEHPEVANALRQTTNIKDKTVAAYKYIKRLGLADKQSPSPDATRAQVNSMKPRPLASISSGNSPLSHANMFANGLTDELKATLLREMMESTKGA